MKKIFFALLVGSLPSVAMINGAYAQNSKNVLAFNSTTFKASLANADAASKMETNSEMSTISIKAIKNFKSSFKEATDAQWSKIKNGYVAWFKLSGIVNRTFYDKRGNWYFTVAYYDETKLPRDVRAIVKRVYYDYTISGIQEISIEDKVIYLVTVQDEKTLKTLRVCDGDMDIVGDYIK
jgi:hypothetical protein